MMGADTSTRSALRLEAGSTAGRVIDRCIDPARDRRRLVVFFAGLIIFYVGVLLVTQPVLRGGYLALEGVAEPQPHHR